MNECTVGIQNSTGTIGLQCVFNAAYLHDSMAIQFTGWPEWVSASPTSGNIPPHSSTDVSLEFNAQDVENGIHTAQMLVQSNDLTTPEVLLELTMEVVDVTSVDETRPLPSMHALAQNVPNPFNPVTRIEFSLPVPGPAQLRIFDVRGTLVRTLVEETLPAGVHSYVWDGRTTGGQHAASGTYFYRLNVEGHQFVRRMNLIK